MKFHWIGGLVGVITSVLGTLVANQTILNAINPKLGAAVGIAGAVVAAVSHQVGSTNGIVAPKTPNVITEKVKEL